MGVSRATPQRGHRGPVRPATHAQHAQRPGQRGSRPGALWAEAAGLVHRGLWGAGHSEQRTYPGIRGSGNTALPGRGAVQVQAKGGPRLGREWPVFAWES